MPQPCQSHRSRRERMLHRSFRACQWASLGAWLIAAVALPAWAREAPTPMKVGQTIHLTLEKDASKDYLIPLSKGTYWILWDGRRTDGAPSNLMGKVQLLKNNGSLVDSSLLSWNEVGVTARTGRQF